MMKNFLKDISIYGLGEFITRGSSFLALIFYSHLLNKSEIGLFGYVLAITGIASVFFNLGLDNGYSRYFFEYKIEEYKKLLTTSLSLFILFWNILLLFFIFFLLKNLSQIFSYNNNSILVLYLGFLSMSLKTLSSTFNQVLRNQFKSKQYILYNFMSTILALICSIFLIYFTTLKTSAIFLGMIIADIIILPFRIMSIRNLFCRGIKIELLIKMLSYGIPFVPTALCYWVYSSIDRIMLKHMLNAESVGLYTIAAIFSGIMSIISSAISQAWSPYAFKLYEEDIEKAKFYYNKFFKILIISIFTMILCTSLIGREFLIMAFPKDYEQAFYPLMLLMIGQGFLITTQITALGISLKKKTIFFLYINFLVVLINIILNYILIPIYREIGASLATMFSYLLLTFLYGLVSQILFPLKYDFKFIILLISLLPLILCLTLFDFSIRILLFICLMVVLFKKNTFSSKKFCEELR